MPAEYLQRDGKSGRAEPAGNAHLWQTGEVTGQGKNVHEIHRQGMVELLAQLEGGDRRSGRENRVDVLECLEEILPNQRPDLLSLEVVRVIVAGRERVGAEHDPPLDLGTETGRASLGIHLAQPFGALRPEPVPN